MSFKLVCVVLAVTVALSEAANYWQACKDEPKTPMLKFNTVSIKGCKDGVAPCEVKVGTNATITLNFTMNEDVTDVTSKVCGLLFGQCVGMPLPQPDDCKLLNKGESCPMKKNNSYVVTISVPLSSTYPHLKVVTKLTFYDASKTEIGCAELLMQLT